MKISLATYSLLVTLITLLGTFFAPWWSILICIAILSYFSSESSTKTSAVAGGIVIAIWTGLAIFKDTMALGKISEITGALLMGVKKPLLYSMTGAIISIPTILFASLGKQVSNFINK
jgi:hypothetical protein